MPAPASQPTWATDTNYTNGPATIPGTATKVAPSAPVQAEGNIPQDKPAAQVMNWWQNLVGQWTTWLEAERARLASYIGGADGSDEWVYGDADGVPDPRARTLCMSPLGKIQTGRREIVGGAAAGVGGTTNVDDGWRPMEIVLAGGGPGGTDTYSGPNGAVDCTHPQHSGYVNLDDILRSGMTITAVAVLVDPGTAQATASDRMKFSLVKRNTSAFAAASIVGSANADATANQQTIALTGLSEVVDKDPTSYWLHIWSSKGADPATHDVIYGIAVVVTDPGPRNF